MKVEIPEKLREHVAPRRSRPDLVTVPSEKSAKRELDAIAKTYEKKRSYGSSPKTQVEAGLRLNKRDGLQSARKEAHAIMCAPTLDAVRAASIDALAMCEILSHRERWDATFSMVVAVARGVCDGIAMMMRSLDFALSSPGSYTKSIYVTNIAKGFTGSRWINDWQALRHAVCAADDAEYARARKLAEGLRKKNELHRRARLAFLFPDEPWASDDLRAVVASPKLETHAFSFLLSACGDPALIREFLALRFQRTHVSQHALDLAIALSPHDALEIFRENLDALLVKPKYGPLLKTPPRDVAQAIALFRTKEAAAILAPYTGHAVIGPIVADFFRDAPELKNALEDIAKGKTKAADAAQRVIASGAKRAGGAVAKEEDVPRVLRERPWRRAKDAPKSAPRVIALTLPKNAKEHIDLEGVVLAKSDARDMTAAELEKWRREVKKKGGFAYADVQTIYKKGHAEYARVPDKEGLRAWNEAHVFVQTYTSWLARHGVSAIPGFTKRDWVRWLAYQDSDDGDERYVDVLARIVSPRIAPVMARIAARRKNFKQRPIAWMLEHAETAALGLVPDAVGKAGEARDDARAALALMARKGAADAVRKVARDYGSEAAAEIDALVSRDPLALDATPPKPPSFLRIGDLPIPTLAPNASGARLGDDAFDALLEMLRVAPLDPPYPGIEEVRRACDAKSLGALALELTEQWVLAGCNGRFEWMLFAAAHFPSDDGTRRVAQLARDWARRDRKKAPRGCSALAGIATDAALMHLGHIAATSRFDDVRRAASTLLDEAAAARGIGRAELEDRTVPDLELGASGTIELSFGKRAFTVTLDEALKPVIVNEKAFPRANKDDDATLVKAARARFDALKRDCAAIADRQIRRFESAMITARTWTAEDFRARVATHPLLRHLARRVVWEALPAKGAHYTFRVAEDGTLADVRDAAIDLGAARVRIPHPARMTAADRTAWSTLFGDYHIVQPFEQLARVVPPPPTNDERIARKITTHATKLLGTLESRGWRRDNRGYVHAYTRALVTGGEARIAIKPGISMEDVAHAGDQTTEGAELPVAQSALDPVDYAEITRDLDALL